MTSSLWRASCGVDTVLVQWDGDVVAFHRPSGLTHLLNPAMAQMLADLSQGRTDTQTLVDRFIDSPNSEQVSAILDHVMTVLFRLEELGLVERVTTDSAG